MIAVSVVTAVVTVTLSARFSWNLCRKEDGGLAAPVFSNAPGVGAYGVTATEPVVATGTFEPLPAETQLIVTRSPALNEVPDAAEAVHVLPELNEDDAIAVPPFLARTRSNCRRLEPYLPTR